MSIHCGRSYFTMVDAQAGYSLDTDIAQYEQLDQLSRQLQWYKNFFDHAADAVFVVQPETWSILDANDYAAYMMGTPKDELVGAFLPEFHRIFLLLSRSSSPTVLSELTLVTAARGEIMVEVHARFIDFDGRKYIQASARDVSEQRAMTDKLVQENKLALLGQLSAGVAHEIRNPLAAVNLNLQLLQRLFPAQSQEYLFISTALSGVERIGQIVESTLNFSRPALRAIDQEDIREIIQESLELVSTTFARKTIIVEFKPPTETPPVKVDRKQMQQVFINLLTNAADAIRAKGTIRIDMMVESDPRAGDYVVTSITDTGIGISREDMHRIFDPFFTRKADGTGLGLPITQKIVNNHGGSIDVQSVPGVGSTFYVKLPIVRR